MAVFACPEPVDRVNRCPARLCGASSRWTYQLCEGQ